MSDEAAGPVSESKQPDPPARPEATEADAKCSGDSATFARCTACHHAEHIDLTAGTLLCSKHDMYINAEADEIPDDCPEHEPNESESNPAPST